MTIKIIAAESEAHIQHVISLSQEYVTWMIGEIRQRYPQLDLAGFTAERSYDNVRKKFPGEHVPPYGRLYVAMRGDEVGGCIALARLSDSICEMRTLYVRPEFRGQGVAKTLAETVLHEARKIGYTHMRLDTLAFMDGAQTLYRSLGFHEIAPYRDVPDSVRPYIRFFEMDLNESGLANHLLPCSV